MNQTLEEISCGACPQKVVGRAILLIPTITDEEGVEGKFLHTQCFEELIHEMMKQETTTMFTIAIGSIPDLIDGVEMREH